MVRYCSPIDFEAEAQYAAKSGGNSSAANAKMLGELVGLLDAKRIELPIANAYYDLANRHTYPKIVLN